jgi:hypothetical protein
MTAPSDNDDGIIVIVDVDHHPDSTIASPSVSTRSTDIRA